MKKSVLILAVGLVLVIGGSLFAGDLVQVITDKETYSNNETVLVTARFNNYDDEDQMVFASNATFTVRRVGALEGEPNVVQGVLTAVNANYNGNVAGRNSAADVGYKTFSSNVLTTKGYYQVTVFLPMPITSNMTSPTTRAWKVIRKI